MANDILLPLLDTVKGPDGKPLYCCVKRFLVMHQQVKTGKLADAWNMHRNTISNWRRKLKLGEIECQGSPNCRLAKGMECSAQPVSVRPKS